MAGAGTAATDMRDVPVSVLRWRVQWDDLLALEPRTGSSAGSRDRLIVHRKGRPGLASPGQDAPLAEELRCFPSTSMVQHLSISPALPPFRSPLPTPLPPGTPPSHTPRCQHLPQQDKRLSKPYSFT